jgi:hypothetical protein
VFSGPVMLVAADSDLGVMNRWVARDFAGLGRLGRAVEDTLTWKFSSNPTSSTTNAERSSHIICLWST